MTRIPGSFKPAWVHSRAVPALLWPLYLGVDAVYSRFLVDALVGAGFPLVLASVLLSYRLRPTIAFAVALDVVAVGVAVFEARDLVTYPMPVRPLTVIAAVYLLGAPLVSVVSSRWGDAHPWKTALRLGLIGWLVAATFIGFLVRIGIPITHALAASPSLGLLPGFAGVMLLSAWEGLLDGGIAMALGRSPPVRTVIG